MSLGSVSTAHLLINCWPEGARKLPADLRIIIDVPLHRAFPPHCSSRSDQWQPVEDPLAFAPHLNLMTGKRINQCKEVKLKYPCTLKQALLSKAVLTSLWKHCASSLDTLRDRRWERWTTWLFVNCPHIQLKGPNTEASQHFRVHHLEREGYTKRQNPSLKLATQRPRKQTKNSYGKSNRTIN